MRIGHYAPTAFDPGGVSSYVKRISEHQRAQGHEVLLFVLGDHGSSTRPPWVRHEEDAFNVVESALAAGCDILHAHSTLPSSTVAHRPVVRTAHGHESYCVSGSKFFARQNKPCDVGLSVIGCAARHALCRCGSLRPSVFRERLARVEQEQAMVDCTHTLCVSEYVAKMMIQAGADRSRIEVLHLPVPTIKGTPQTVSNAEPPRFLFAGRIVPEKGLTWLLESVARSVSGAELDIAGEGRELQHCQGLAAELGLEHRVTFHGWLDDGRLAKLYESCRAVVVPSMWHEPAGWLPYEAMAHCRPVIVSATGALSEAVQHASNGTVVEPGDVDALASAIDALACDAGLARRLGEAGYSWGIDHSISSHTEKLESIYSKVIRDARCP